VGVLSEDATEPHRIEVAARDDLQTFEVPLTSEALQAAKDRVDERARGE
jgi:hypothetical protein